MEDIETAAVPGKFDAIVLVGGAGSRLGGTDKAAVELGGRCLVSWSFEAVRGARTLVVVGKTAAPVPERAVCVVEDPPGGGPAAATIAGLRAVEESAAWTYVLACDLPGAVDAIQLLAAADVGDADGVVLAAPDGRSQWLLGRYRSFALYDAASMLGEGTDCSMRDLVGDLQLETVVAPDDVWRDVDTWADHEQWAHALEQGNPAP